MQTELRLKTLKIAVEINDGVAKTIAEQTFKNDNSCSVEATYLFPLPSDAAVSDFSIFMDGKKVSGEVLDKDKARSLFEGIVRRMRDPALLEYVGHGLFRANLFPVAAGAEPRIQLEYSQYLPAENGMFRYEYPLSRPGADGSPESLVIAGTITSRAGIKTLYSPTHPVDTGRDGESKASFSLESKPADARQSFVLYYAISDQDFGANLVTSKKKGEDGYFLLTLAPKLNWQRKEVTAKDIIFVLDTSGSMAGEKIKQAKNVLSFCLENLNPDDRFGLITFSTIVRPLAEKLLPAAEDNIERARAFIADMHARGGTDIHSALQTAMGMIGEGKRPTIVLFITDGLPTVGETDEMIIARAVQTANRGKDRNIRARLFTFGVGYDVNTHLLDRLAEENQGLSDYIKPEEEMEVRISNFYDKIVHPVLTNVQIDWGRLKVYDLYPKQLPDMFKGSQITLFGRYENSAETEIVLRGVGQERNREYRFAVRTPDENLSNPLIPRLWASRKIGYLLNAIRLNGEDKELKDEIIRLSLEFGIITPFTSMLIQEDARTRTAWANSALSPEVAAVFREVVRRATGESGGEVGAVAGGAGAGVTISPEQARAAFEAKSGRDSVGASASLQAMKQQAQLGPGAISGESAQHVRYIGSRTFYRLGNVWVDGTPSSDRQVRISVKFLSDAYFQLIRLNGELARCLSLGPRVVVSLPQVLLEVSDRGLEYLSSEDLQKISAR